MGSIQKSYKVILERKAEKELKKLPKADYQKLRTAIDKLSQDPRGHNTIKLTDFENEYRCRVGNYRILFTIEDKILTVYVIEIINRKDAYR
jgi:mRNA interferase RelE/StbE